MPIIELRRQNNKVLRASTWLLDHSKDVFSQFGEDGVLQTIFSRIGEGKRWCVDVGAWDGKHWSNTHNLMLQGWSGVQIESDPARFAALKETYATNPLAVCKREIVGPHHRNLQNILARTEAPFDFDLLNIDIQGNDWHVWNELQNYRPRVVVVSFNPSVPNDVCFIQDFDEDIHHGCSLLALQELGRTKGYELAAATLANAIFVLREEFAVLGINDNSLDSMYSSPHTARIFQSYDGTLFTSELHMLWCGRGSKAPADALQFLPANQRKYSDAE